MRQPDGPETPVEPPRTRRKRVALSARGAPVNLQRLCALRRTGMLQRLRRRPAPPTLLDHLAVVVAV